FNPFFIRAILPTLGRNSQGGARDSLVSIPSSSGQYFQPDRNSHSPRCGNMCFNPFFIRAILPTQKRQYGARHHSLRFNPFFIKAILPTPGQHSPPKGRITLVSIPSSSGQYFQRLQAEYDADIAKNGFQSLLHQGNTSNVYAN